MAKESEKNFAFPVSSNAIKCDWKNTEYSEDGYNWLPTAGNPGGIVAFVGLLQVNAIIIFIIFILKSMLFPAF